MSLFSFGPIDQNLFAKMYAPVDTGAIEDLLNNNDLILDSSFVSKLPPDQRGLVAVEYLIFGGSPSNTSKVLNAFGTQPQRTAYLRCLCDNLQEHINYIITKWSRGGDGYVDTFIAADGDNQNSSLGILANRIVSQISYIKDARLAIPMGQANGSKPRPELVDGKYSSESLMLLMAELAGIQAVFTGQPNTSVDNKGLIWLLDKTQAKSGDSLLSLVVLRQFDVIYSAVGEIDVSLEEAIRSNNDKVKSLLVEVDKLKKIIEVDVMKHLYIKT